MEQTKARSLLAALGWVVVMCVLGVVCEITSAILWRSLIHDLAGWAGETVSGTVVLSVSFLYLFFLTLGTTLVFAAGVTAYANLEPRNQEPAEATGESETEVDFPGRPNPWLARYQRRKKTIENEHRMKR